MSVTQSIERYQQILEEEVPRLGKQLGAVKRKRKGGLDLVTLVATIIFGFWQVPDARLDTLAQIAARRQVLVTASAICQRFSQELAEVLLAVLQRLVQVEVRSPAVEIGWLKQFAAVVAEDSSTVSLPESLIGWWRGCGAVGRTSAAAVKLFVRWDVLTGQVHGPRLSDARTKDHRSPFSVNELLPGSLYLADLGFFGLKRLYDLARGWGTGAGNKRFFVTRWQPTTRLYTRSGHLLQMEGLLPQQVGQVREIGVILGKQWPQALRLILVRVPEEVAEQRRERIRQTAADHGRQPSERLLLLACWTIVLTNLPAKRADFCQVLVLLRLRWQIERLFRLWKQDGLIDEWRGKKPMRILCEFYGKLCAMVIQSALLQEGCWLDPLRSMVKAACALRHEVNRLMLAFYEGTVSQTVASIVCSLRAGCRIDRRAAHPSTAQLLLDGLDWQLDLLLT